MSAPPKDEMRRFYDIVDRGALDRSHSRSPPNSSGSPPSTAGSIP